MYEGDSKAVRYSIAASVSFHGLLLLLYIYFVVMPPETRNVVLSNVDLIMQEKEQQAPAQPKNKTLDFLKLALPTIPKLAQPEQPKLAQIDIKTPDRHRAAMDLPKALTERAGRVGAEAKLDMDAGRRLDSGIKDAGLDMQAGHAAVAAAPRIELEEIGLKKAPKLPGNIKFDESAPAVRPQSMQELNMAVDNARRASAAPQALSERQGSVAASRPAMFSAGPSQRLTEAQSAGVQPAARRQPAISAASLSLRRNESLRQAEAPETQRLEITGPLSKRKVIKYYVPPFPDWARERGILEAAVSVKFFVDAAGRVLDNPTVDKTSGYGALDRVAQDAIRRWAFEQLPGAGKQWGIITFRFVSD